MDHMVATFHRLTGAPLPETVRMASLTPARIIRKEAEFGSIAEGKRADLVVLGSDLTVQQVFRDGELLAVSAPECGTLKTPNRK